MVDYPLIPTNTPFSYNVGIDYDADPNARTGFSVTADLGQISQYFKLIHTYRDTSDPNSTTPTINPNESSVISYVVSHPGLELTMGTWNSAVAVAGGSSGPPYSAGLMDTPAYTDAWVQMLVSAFGSTAAVQQHLTAILLGNEFDNGR